MMKTAFGLGVASVLGLFLLNVNLTFASDALPPCLDNRGNVLPINNAQVLQWKQSSPNGYLARGHVIGRIERLFSDATGHNHFAIQIGNLPQQMLEVIYNQEFGALPNLAIGMQVEACGDYITSRAQSGPYPPSPAGAIIHWVHVNPRGQGHPSGYVAIDGILYGYGNPNAPQGAHYLIPDYPVYQAQ